MITQPSTSTMFSAYGWESDTLTVTYRSGGKTFNHPGVPEAVYAAMRAAENDPEMSVGKIFHAQVKKQYPGEAALPEPPERDIGPVGEEP